MRPKHACKSFRKLELKFDRAQQQLHSEMSKISRSMSQMVEIRKTEYETIRKSANSITVITRFLAGLKKITNTEFRGLLEESDALLSTVLPLSVSTDSILLSPDRSSYQSGSTMSPHTVEETSSDHHNLSTANVALLFGNQMPSSDLRGILEESDVLPSTDQPLSVPTDHIPSPDRSPHQSGSTMSANTVEETSSDHDNLSTANVALLSGNKMSSTDLRGILEVSDVLPSTDQPLSIPTDPIPSPDRSPHQSGSTMSANTVEETSSDHDNLSTANVALLSGNTSDSNQMIEDLERKKLRMKYNNKYRYMPTNICSKVPDTKPKSIQSINNVDQGASTSSSTQNELNTNNGKKFTPENVILSKEVYEKYKRKLTNHPYNDPTLSINSADKLHITWKNGETVMKPLSYVQPLLIIKKFDSTNSIPVQYKQKIGEHSRSSTRVSNRTTHSNNIINTIAEKSKIKTRLNAKKSTNIKPTKRKLTVEKKQEPSKKKKK